AYAASLDLSGLTAQDYGLVRAFLLRAPSLPGAVRSELAEQVADPVVGRLRPAPPPGIAAETFLACVAAVYQQRQSRAGGGAAADNLAVTGVHALAPGPVVCTAIEHHAVLHTSMATGDDRRAPVGTDGLVDLDALAELLDPEVRVVSVMLANNEVGTIQPLDRVVTLVRERAPG